MDLQSQLTNLESTRGRIQEFLKDAKTVDEALRINQELSNIEAQIEQIKGQMNYLNDRSAYSTITANLEPELPILTPTPTPTAQPTATPIPWNPGETFSEAKSTVTVLYQGIGIPDLAGCSDPAHHSAASIDPVGIMEVVKSKDCEGGECQK